MRRLLADTRQFAARRTGARLPHTSRWPHRSGSTRQVGSPCCEVPCDLLADSRFAGIAEPAHDLLIRRDFLIAPVQRAESDALVEERLCDLLADSRFAGTLNRRLPYVAMASSIRFNVRSRTPLLRRAIATCSRTLLRWHRRTGARPPHTSQWPIAPVQRAKPEAQAAEGNCDLLTDSRFAPSSAEPAHDLLLIRRNGLIAQVQRAEPDALVTEGHCTSLADIRFAGIAEPAHDLVVGRQRLTSLRFNVASATPILRSAFDISFDFLPSHIAAQSPSPKDHDVRLVPSSSSGESSSRLVADVNIASISANASTSDRGLVKQSCSGTMALRC